MMNKKGYYATIMVLLTLAAVMALNYQLNKKMDSIDREIGDSQAAILRINQDVDVVQGYVQDAARIAIKRTVKQLAKNPQMLGLEEQCPLLNEEKYSELVKVHWHNKIKEAVNENMNLYMIRYEEKSGTLIPTDNFEVYLKEGKIIGTAVKPVLLPVKTMSGRYMGETAYRPAFELEYDHKLEEYPESFVKLGEIAEKCGDIEDPGTCVDQEKKQDWEVELVDGDYVFTIPRGELFSCYRLRLPQTQQTNT